MYMHMCIQWYWAQACGGKACADMTGDFWNAIDYLSLKAVQTYVVSSLHSNHFVEKHKYVPNDLELISKSFVFPMPERRPTEIHDSENLKNASNSIENQFLTLLMISRYFLNDLTIISLTSFFHDFHHFVKVNPSSW